MIEAFSQRLRIERLRLNLDQRALAEIANVSRGSQMAYEAGKTPPTIEYLWKISEIGIDIHYLMTGVRLGDVPGFEDRQVLDMMAELSARERAAVMALLMHLTGRVTDLADPLGLGGLPARPTLQSPARDFKPE